MALTTKQRLFVEYYLGVSKGNATDAARRAGYAAPNTAGPRLLVNAGIRPFVERRLEEAALSSDRILKRLSEIAEGGVGDFVVIKSKGRLGFDFNRARKAGKFGLLKKVKETLHGVEIECHDPLRALELLGKYRGLLKDQVEVKRLEHRPHEIPDDDPRFMAGDQRPALEGDPAP